MASYTQTDRPFKITTPLGPDILLITGLEGHEEISDLFKFHVTLIADLNNEVRFDGIIEHTRDAMWQTDGYLALLSAVASLAITCAKLAEDLEIWASTEFDYVSIADGYSRSSVLMPQKRNPYSLSIIRGASGTMIGRLSGFLAVSKSPSARSDNLIYAYGEVPRALDLARRTTRLTAGVISTLQVNSGRMWQALESGFSQSTDLAEFIMGQCGVDYRTGERFVSYESVKGGFGARPVMLTGLTIFGVCSLGATVSHSTAAPRAWLRYSWI